MKNKITIKEFFNSEEYLVIHCDKIDKAITLLKAFDKLGYTWSNGYRYYILKTEFNCWFEHEEHTCYSNKKGYSSKIYYKREQITIYEFEDVIFESEEK